MSKVIYNYKSVVFICRVWSRSVQFLGILASCVIHCTKSTWSSSTKRVPVPVLWKVSNTGRVELIHCSSLEVLVFKLLLEIPPINEWDFLNHINQRVKILILKWIRTCFNYLIILSSHGLQVGTRTLSPPQQVQVLSQCTFTW